MQAVVPLALPLPMDEARPTPLPAAEPVPPGPTPLPAAEPVLPPLDEAGPSPPSVDGASLPAGLTQYPVTGNMREYLSMVKH